jgi:ankyrin repeat protein
MGFLFRALCIGERRRFFAFTATLFGPCLFFLFQFGWTPLHDCAQEGNVLAVGFLLDSGADANLCDMVRDVFHMAAAVSAFIS